MIVLHDGGLIADAGRLVKRLPGQCYLVADGLALVGAFFSVHSVCLSGSLKEPILASRPSVRTLAQDNFSAGLVTAKPRRRFL